MDATDAAGASGNLARFSCASRAIRVVPSIGAASGAVEAHVGRPQSNPQLMHGSRTAGHIRAAGSPGTAPKKHRRVP